VSYRDTPQGNAGSHRDTAQSNLSYRDIYNQSSKDNVSNFGHIRINKQSRVSPTKITRESLNEDSIMSNALQKSGEAEVLRY